MVRVCSDIEQKKPGAYARRPKGEHIATGKRPYAPSV